jgi:hypothetical protein
MRKFIKNQKTMKTTSSFKLLGVVMIFHLQLFAQNNPTIGVLVNNKVNNGTKISQLIVSGISDGDVSATQAVTVSATSSNNSLLSIVGVLSNANSKLAVIKVQEFGTAGVVTVTVSAMDVNGTTQKSFVVAIGNYYPKGVLSTVYDLVFWARVWPFTNGISLRDSVLNAFYTINDPNYYCGIGLTAGPSLTPATANLPCSNNGDCPGGPYTCFQKDDGMTLGFSGFLTPTVTGVYTFTGIGQDYFDFRIADGETLPENTSKAGAVLKRLDNSTTPGLGPVYITTLTGGKIYAYRMAAYVVFAKNYSIEWAGPGFNRRQITDQHSMPFYDITLPSITSSGITRASLGSDFIKVKWGKGTDDTKVEGYNIYLDGVLYASTKDTTILVTALGINSEHSVAVVAYDKVKNESLISNILDFTTYDIDNTPPTPPTSITSTIGDLSAQIRWSGANDIGSEVYGYNVYQNGTKVNTSLIFDSQYIVKVLSPKTAYSIEVEAVDAANNVSLSKISYTITTTGFNALVASPGIKKSYLSFDYNVIGRNGGVGINIDENAKYYPGGMTNPWVTAMKPSIIREGGFRQNALSFTQSTANNRPAGDYSLLRMLAEAERQNSYISFQTGLWTDTDWYNDPEGTALKFMEFINGPTTVGGTNPVSTPQGNRRASYGHPESYLKNIKGFILEIGNETWGGNCLPSNNCTGVNHWSPYSTPNDYQTYGEWARTIARSIKSSPYYDSTKFIITYSGREPTLSSSYGLHEKLFTGDDGSVDWIAPGGYLGGNLGYVEGIPRGDSELDYYKSAWDRMRTNLAGLDQTNDAYMARTSKKRPIPYFFYETNMTVTDYNGRLGQGILVSDYWMSGMKKGLAFPCLFALDGGEWATLDVTNNLRPLATYMIARWINFYTKGNILNSSVRSLDVVTGIRNGAPVILTSFDPIGHTITSDSGKYSITLHSRDYVNDHQVVVKFPSDINAASLRKFVITGSDFSGKSYTVDSTAMVYRDSLLVTLPKHSVVILTFGGKNLNQPTAPLGFNRYRRISKLDIIPIDGTSLSVTGIVGKFIARTDKKLNTVSQIQWEISKPDTMEVEILISQDSIVDIIASGTCKGNGIIKLKAYTSDNNPYTVDTITVVISGQIDEGVEECGVAVIEVPTVPGSVLKKVFENTKLSPNPVENKLLISSTENILDVVVSDLTGRDIFSTQFLGTQSKVEIDTYSLKAGLYLVKIRTLKGVVTKKIVKAD